MNAKERIDAYGAKSASDAELLAVLLGISETKASGLLEESGGLYSLDPSSVVEIPGLGAVSATRLEAALELGTRYLRAQADLPQVRSPSDAASVFLPDMARAESELFYVLLLDTKNRVKRVVKLYQGSVNTAMIRVGEVFKAAVAMQATSIVIGHCHPSGDPTPSPEDVQVTSQIVQAGKLLDIEVLDHLIIGGDRWVSLKERGLGF